MFFFWSTLFFILYRVSKKIVFAFSGGSNDMKSITSSNDEDLMPTHNPFVKGLPLGSKFPSPPSRAGFVRFGDSSKESPFSSAVKGASTKPYYTPRGERTYQNSSARGRSGQRGRGREFENRGAARGWENRRLVIRVHQNDEFSHFFIIEKLYFFNSCLRDESLKQELQTLISLNYKEIEQVEQFRYLGVDLNPKMSYKHHVGRIVTKYKQAIGALCRTIRKWVLISVIETLYKSTIEPIITYAREAWYPQGVLQNSIERVKKFAAKLTTNDTLTQGF
jgi:hypothetical protein